MEQRLSLVTLGVTDLDRSRRFYEDGLGWQRGNDHAEVVFYQAGGIVVGLFSRASLAADAHLSPHGEGFSGITLAYNARDRAEVDRVMLEAEAAGARILKTAREVFWGGYSGYFTDPDGHVWEVAHNPFWTIRPDGSVDISAPPPAS